MLGVMPQQFLEVLIPTQMQPPLPSDISHLYLVNNTFSQLSQIWLILSKLAFNSSMYQTSSNIGNPRMSTIPIPLMTDLLPSPNVTISIFPSKRVLNKALLPVMYLEQPLSKYHKHKYHLLLKQSKQYNKHSYCNM